MNGSGAQTVYTYIYTLYFIAKNKSYVLLKEGISLHPVGSILCNNNEFLIHQILFYLFQIVKTPHLRSGGR